MRVALVHDWLTGMRGGEKCLEGFCEIFPDADIYTLLYVPGMLSKTIESHRIHTSFIQRMPRAKKAYRNYLPLFPTAIEQFDLREYDLVLSSSHCVAKGVITEPKTCHFSYIHTPMRYVWEMYHDYFGPDKMGWMRRKIIPMAANYLRLWDVASAGRVDDFIANSRHVANRIMKHYHRQAEVINPPVDTGLFELSDKCEDFFLVVSALTPYKRIDLAIEACNKLGRRLVVVGIGDQMEYLKSIAGPTIEFHGWLSDAEVRDLYQQCRAFIFPQEEDFGITPLEAQSCGKPVIAYGKGGSLETVVGIFAGNDTPIGPLPEIDGSEQFMSGIFFKDQTVESLIGAISAFENIEGQFVPERIRQYALRFDRERFKERVSEYLKTRYALFRENIGMT